ncbi:MAG: histidine triad nucleotide-binding protein [Oscillospiraceae bacterium]|nr:histidine triad nucleotide-binding protein [Oscillospiraceae bacterium]
MENCLFCKIAAGEIPSNKIYEDDKVLAFYDIEPQAPVHFLVIPKEHISCADEIDGTNSAIVAHVFEVIAKIAKDLKLEKGYRIVNNCGEEGGQTVKHLHFHVLGGRLLAWPPG